MKRIISLFTAIIIMVVVCETRLTTVKAINSKLSGFSFSYFPGAPGSEVTTRYITVNRKECDLTISSILNCKVVVTVSGKSPITIYSTDTYHITFTSYGPNIDISPYKIGISFFPIDKNSPSSCSGYVTTT